MQSARGPQSTGEPDVSDLGFSVVSHQSLLRRCEYSDMNDRNKREDTKVEAWVFQGRWPARQRGFEVANHFPLTTSPALGIHPCRCTWFMSKATKCL